MQLKDNIKSSKIEGIFKIKSFYADGTFDEYVEQNLIMDEARNNMAQLIGGVTTEGDIKGEPINKIVLGTLGHHGTDILDYIAVGDSEGDEIFDSTRTSLISEGTPGAKNYVITFDPEGGTLVTDTSAEGKMYEGSTLIFTDTTQNTVQRQVLNRTVTYTITIPADNANSDDAENPIIAYTEAGLYAEGEIFSMKTFPGRVKENTVKFIITWSIIF